MTQPQQKKHKPLIIGLTGGIGSGKSTVAAMFDDLGVPIIDADEISREIVQPNSPLTHQIAQHFGQNILDDKGNLRRSVLRDRIFQSEADKKWLEQLLHPKIFATIQERIELYPSNPYVIVIIPLLLEVGRKDFIDKVLVIDASEQHQIDHAMQRDGATRADIQAVMAAQHTRQARLVGADEVITNDGDISDLKAKVLAIHEKFLGLLG